jgi:hypothetical protein
LKADFNTNQLDWSWASRQPAQQHEGQRKLPFFAIQFYRFVAITALPFSLCSTKISNCGTICKSLFKKMGPQIENPQRATFAEGPQMELR